jgi:hypothetical protein
MKRFLKHSNSDDIAEIKKTRQDESFSNSQEGQSSIKSSQPADKPERCNKQHDHLKHFLETFENLKTVIEWSICGEANELPIDANFEIDGFGPISFPLQNTQANEFVAHFNKYPSHFEIDKSKIKFTNPGWDSAFEQFIDRVKKELGTTSKHSINFIDDLYLSY